MTAYGSARLSDELEACDTHGRQDIHEHIMWTPFVELTASQCERPGISMIAEEAPIWDVAPPPGLEIRISSELAVTPLSGAEGRSPLGSPLRPSRRATGA